MQDLVLPFTILGSRKISSQNEDEGRSMCWEEGGDTCVGGRGVVLPSDGKERHLAFAVPVGGREENNITTFCAIVYDRGESLKKGSTLWGPHF